LNNLGADKAAMRAEALIRRARCSPSWGAKLADHVLNERIIPAEAIVAGFWPLPGEIDLFPLLTALAMAGTKICLPVTPPRGQPLTFRRWVPGERLYHGRFNTMHPEGEAATPTFILTPMLAFDRAGYRLGYGAGYYDRTFAALPNAYRLGCAFAAQEFPAVPHGPTDVKLHAIATEKDIWRALESA
jgi:5-formyltetrahydrofolate cyclo-ligase